MSSFATTSGSGPFKAVIVSDDVCYETIKEWITEEKALKYAEVVFAIICEDEKLTLKKYKFECIDK